jgi:hypothetical protein
MFFKEITNINTVNALRQRNEEELAESMMPIGFNDYDSHDTSQVPVYVGDDDNGWLS